MSQEKLALNGGPRLRTEAWPERGLLGAEEKAAVDAMFDEAISSGKAFGYDGAIEQAFCNEFAEFMGGGYADAVNSGTTAVYVALRSLDLEPFTEVVVGAITDPGGFMPIPLLNCIPVPADVAPGSYSTGPEQIEAVLSPLTSAIVVSHIAGIPADIEGIMKLANQKGIPVVEDCAQAHCAKVNGRLLGTFGSTSSFSTMYGKHFCTGGQGGVAFTSNEKVFQRIRWASDRGKPFGCPPGSKNQIASLNFNLGDLGAAIGREQLKKLPGIVERRRRFVDRVRQGIEDLDSVGISAPPPGVEPSYWFAIVNFNADAISCDRDTFIKALEAEGMSLIPDYARNRPHTQSWFVEKKVFGNSGYPWAAPEYKGDRDRKFLCPNVDKVADTTFRLNVWESWGDAEADDVIAIFRKVDDAFGK